MSAGARRTAGGPEGFRLGRFFDSQTRRAVTSCRGQGRNTVFVSLAGGVACTGFASLLMTSHRKGVRRSRSASNLAVGDDRRYQLSFGGTTEGEAVCSGIPNRARAFCCTAKRARARNARGLRGELLMNAHVCHSEARRIQCDIRSRTARRGAHWILRFAQNDSILGVHRRIPPIRDAGC